MNAHDERHFRIICRGHFDKAWDDATKEERERCRQMAGEVEAIAAFEKPVRRLAPPAPAPEAA